MDVMTGLAAVSQALGIAKDLKELDQSIGKAEFKLKNADLTEALAETKVALSEAKIDLVEKEERIAELQRRIEPLTSGEICAICKSGHLETKSVRVHSTFGVMGHKLHEMVFSNPDCGHKESRKVIPPGSD